MLMLLNECLVHNVFIGLKWSINVNEWYCSAIIARLLGSMEILVKLQ